MKKLKQSLPLFLLLSLFFFFPFCSLCYGEVVLTDEEAQQMMSEITESKKDLQIVKEELEAVKSTYEEQKTSYEMQLTEAENDKNKLKTVAIASSSSSVILFVLTILLIIL